MIFLTFLKKALSAVKTYLVQHHIGLAGIALTIFYATPGLIVVPIMINLPGIF